MTHQDRQTSEPTRQLMACEPVDKDEACSKSHSCAEESAAGTGSYTDVRDRSCKRSRQSKWGFLSRLPLAAGLLCAVFGIGCALSFVLGQGGYTGMSDLPASSADLLWSVLAFLFALLFWHTHVRRGLRVHAVPLCFGLLFGAVNYFGVMLFAYDSWSFLNGAFAWARALVQIIGQGLPMAAAMTCLHDLFRRGWLQGPDLPCSCRLFSRLRRFYQKHTVLACTGLFVLCWSPYLLAFYPGTVCWDIGEMLAQFFGQRQMDTWHPVFTTWIVGACIWLGRLLGSDNLGAFLFTLLQTLALAFALGCAVQSMRRMGARRMAQGVALAFFALTPLWGGYAQFISKDTLYTALLLLFTLQTLSLLRMQARKEAPKARLLCGYAATILCTCLLRSNGLYVVLPTVVLTVLFAVRGRDRLRLGAVSAVALAAVFAFSSLLLPVLGIKDETVSGLYSVCFQQSARVLRDHADDITPEEFAEIDLVLDAQRLPELYEPWISDPVKFTFKQYGQGAAVEKEALTRYRGTWATMALRFPVSYVESFVAGNSAYYAFTPKMEGETYNNQAGNRLVFETYSLGEDPRYLHTTQLAALETARTLLAAFARGWRHIPLLALLYCCPVYTWLLVATGVSLARQKRIRSLIAFLPALLSLATCMLSPVNDYFRYFLPIVAMTLPLLVFAQEAHDTPVRC